MNRSDPLAVDNDLEHANTAASLSTTPTGFTRGVVFGLGGWIVLAYVIGFSVRSLVMMMI